MDAGTTTFVSLSEVNDMKLSDYVIDFIRKQGVQHIFEFIGGAIVHLLDSTYGRDDVQCVSMHHEQGSAFAAEAYARVNGNLGVAMATSGPGALNMVTGIGSCYFDSVPCLFITGQVNTYEYKFDRPVRQVGFQETDIVSVVKPIAKYAVMVLESADIRYELEKAVYLAQEGRKGPVLLDIPMDVQRAEIEPECLRSFFDSDEYKLMSFKADIATEINEIIQLICQASRPMILAGGGVRTANAVELLREFIDKTNIPMVVSLMGLDAVPHDHESFMGMIGSYGNRYSNLAVANCDLLLVLGSRLDSRQTGTRPDTFARGAKIVQVDIDPAELEGKITAAIKIQCDIKCFLSKINRELEEMVMPEFQGWRDKLRYYKLHYPTQSKSFDASCIEPNWFMERLATYSEEAAVVCVDVGQHQMWAAQSFCLKRNQRMLQSGGMGAMGFALPAAIGAVMANPTGTGIVIAGDGGIQLNIQELSVIAKYNLPIKIIVLNNNCLGMVRQFQDIYFSGRRQSTVIGYSVPDLVSIVKAYGIPAYHIHDHTEVDEILSIAFSNVGPVFVNVSLELETVVSPKLVVNRPIEDMFPFLDREELRSLMLVELVEEIAVPK